MLSAKWSPFCSGFNMSKWHFPHRPVSSYTALLVLYLPIHVTNSHWVSCLFSSSKLPNKNIYIRDALTSFEVNANVIANVTTQVRTSLISSVSSYWTSGTSGLTRCFELYWISGNDVAVRSWWDRIYDLILVCGRKPHIDGLVQDCSNSTALAMELLQSWTKPSILLSSAKSVRWVLSIGTLSLR